MDRKKFLKYSLLATGSLATLSFNENILSHPTASRKIGKPLAITMWDFSWLERRWKGGSYEDWDKILDELVERGYDAVRIDAYPHLIGENPTKEWTLLPCWDVQDWGSPGKIKVAIHPFLNQFISKCKKRNVKVALSTWYREDMDNVRMKITSPEKMAENWLKTLDLIASEDLLDTILYVDMCNEWTSVWSPMLQDSNHNWDIPESIEWMNRTLDIVRTKYPELSFTFSFDYSGQDILEKFKKNPLPNFDFLEQHIWMASLNNGEFNKTIGYNWDKFSNKSYVNLVENGEKLYDSKKSYWKETLKQYIILYAKAAKMINQPIISTECWAIVDYKDFPLLDWNWIKELCEIGVVTASETGQWVAIATSNFCGPQFIGMWEDVEWHQRLTKLIKNGPISEDLKTKKIIKKLK